MSTIIDRLTEAQKLAMSIKPNVGSFPVLAEVLRRADVFTQIVRDYFSERASIIDSLQFFRLSFQ